MPGRKAVCEKRVQFGGAWLAVHEERNVEHVFASLINGGVDFYERIPIMLLGSSLALSRPYNIWLFLLKEEIEYIN